jgi:hypothetical protein
MIWPPSVTLRPAPSDTVTIRHTNVCILRQSDPTGAELSDHPQTAQFDHLEVGLNVGCDNPTHVQSDPFSAPPGAGGGTVLIIKAPNLSRKGNMSSSMKVSKGLQNIMLDGRGRLPCCRSVRQTLPRPVFLVL